MNIYRTCIIGCGSIGALKPDKIDYPGSPNILTHANAVSRHPRTELMAIIDTDNDQLLKAGRKWNPLLAINSYDALIIGSATPDIVIVAAPTENHYEVLSNILSHPNRPKLIIAEKPFCSDSKEANWILEISEENHVQGWKETPIAIDYIRRYAAKYKEVKAQIDADVFVFGKAQNARILYGRGLKHEGCHAIDLMRYFFGECAMWGVLGNSSIMDRNENDPSVDIIASFEKCDSVIFQPCDGRKYGIFEIDICFEECRLRFIDNGLYVERYPINEENEWGHKSLDYSLSNVLRVETGLNMALYNLIDNAVNFLDGKEDLICTADDAIKVHEILEGSG